ncbi:MAG: ABC transporter permease DevC [Pirellulales bacterium]|nr:ABC transporter permease DevC [Pirellulales bacterium]
MWRPKRVPLAWKNITHNRRRLALALAGVGFAVLLMCMQIGFRNALFDSTVELLRQLNADLIVASKMRYALGVSDQFGRIRLDQIAACPGVKAAWPLYIETRRAVLDVPVRDLEGKPAEPKGDRKPGVGHLIRVLAIEPDDPVFSLPKEKLQKLFASGNVLYDDKSKDDYGRIEVGTQTDLAGHAIKVVDFFSLGTDFANDGNLLTSAQTLDQIFYAPPRTSGLGRVDLGIVKVHDGADAQKIKSQLVDLLPDVDVLTKDEMIDREKSFWENSTPIGFVFLLGTLMGFAVGTIICYQILYSDIDDHMKEFATLKAIGYPNRYFVGVVLQEALLLGGLGFIPGIAVSQLCYWLLGSMTGLLLNLTFWRALFILGLTLVMCATSGALAVRRIFTADPAELF